MTESKDKRVRLLLPLNREFESLTWTSITSQRLRRQGTYSYSSQKYLSLAV